MPPNPLHTLRESFIAQYSVCHNCTKEAAEDAYGVLLDAHTYETGFDGKGFKQAVQEAVEDLLRKNLMPKQKENGESFGLRPAGPSSNGATQSGSEASASTALQQQVAALFLVDSRIKPVAERPTAPPLSYTHTPDPSKGATLVLSERSAWKKYVRQSSSSAALDGKQL